MIRTLATIIFLLSFCFNALAEQTLYCSHPEICKMINHLGPLKTESLISIVGDPHEYEPSILEIKKLISAPLLVTGPNELNPWIKKVLFQRSKIPNLKTISLLFDQNDFLFYPEANGETLSHFWLYPKVYCSLKNKLEKSLSSIGIPLKASELCDSSKAEKQLQVVLLKIKKPIILTHDALLPLFLHLAKDRVDQIVAIKGSGHHEEANPQSIKKMYNALSAPQVIWIQETGINVPQNIINKIRKNDIVIKIDTANEKENAAFSVINELTIKLSTFADKENERSSK